MIREAGAEYVIIGHSERRTLFGETDATVNRKTVAAFAAGLTPIVCIGETLDQRERNETFDVLDRQIKAGLDGLTGEQLALLVIAYEPVWAIGTGRNATPAQAAEAHGHIRQRLRQWFGDEAAEHCHVIYGGSVKPDNIKEIWSRQPDVDGALVGGASLDVRGFFEIVTRSRPGGGIITVSMGQSSDRPDKNMLYYLIATLYVLDVPGADAGHPAAAGQGRRHRQCVRRRQRARRRSVRAAARPCCRARRRSAPCCSSSARWCSGSSASAGPDR